MPGIVVGHINDTSFDAVAEEFAVWNPDCAFGRGTVDGETTLAAESVRYFWLESGSGEVFLPKGTRTQEGDGKPLDSVYIPDATPKEVLDALTRLDAKVETFHNRIRQPIKAMVGRRRGDAFVGDIAGEIWLIVESGLPREEWTTDAEAFDALQTLIHRFRQIGWSTKSLDGWEPVQSGDQLAVSPNRPLKVRGEFRHWHIDAKELRETHTSPARRLGHLRDTAGGCNFAFDAFRRLPLTWLVNTASVEQPDGLNVVNSHVVNIAAETSQTHYHPATPVGGGKPQSEMYLVLDPGVYGLKAYGRTPWLTTFSDLDDFRVFEKTPLSPGSTIYIRPGTGHRGIDAFVNVITLPGFKPRNEVYIDRKIKDTTGGMSPHNSNVTV